MDRDLHDRLERIESMLRIVLLLVGVIFVLLAAQLLPFLFAAPLLSLTLLVVIGLTAFILARSPYTIDVPS